jgi:hypothetical protein
MKKLMPLLAIAVSACDSSLLDRELRDIPNLALSLPATYSDEEEAVLLYDWSKGGDCYRIPAETRLTRNERATTLESRGDAHPRFDEAIYCEFPSFRGTVSPADEPRTEFILSDSHSSMRAVFQELRAPRRFRVNGQEQATVHAWDAIDIEWLPATDQLETVYVSVEAEAGPYSQTVETFQVQGNHVRFTLPALQAGRYVLSLYGEGTAGVEACEGFSSCRAEFGQRVTVPFLVE